MTTTTTRNHNELKEIIKKEFGENSKEILAICDKLYNPISHEEYKSTERWLLKNFKADNNEIELEENYFHYMLNTLYSDFIFTLMFESTLPTLEFTEQDYKRFMILLGAYDNEQWQTTCY